jgi:hypothetical protein
VAEKIRPEKVKWEILLSLTAKQFAAPPPPNSQSYRKVYTALADNVHDTLCFNVANNRLHCNLPHVCLQALHFSKQLIKLNFFPMRLFPCALICIQQQVNSLHLFFDCSPHIMDIAPTICVRRLLSWEAS